MALTKRFQDVVFIAVGDSNFAARALLQYLRNFEQVYKGSPSTGLFLILHGEPAEDIGIPGAGYTFGQLPLAWARSDFESLESCACRWFTGIARRAWERGLSELVNLVRKL